MNEKLKFSWGHIIAFVALIFICYVSFVGLTYLSDGNFAYAIVGIILIAALLLIVFVGGQQLKGTEHRFSKRIIWERILIIGSPLYFTAIMLPFLHAYTVYNHNDQIVSNFTDAIKESKQLFVNYEDYANKRVEALETSLQRVVNTKDIAPKRYKNCGFDGSGDKMQIQNRVKALRLQLLDSINYYQFRDKASKWIDDADQSTSTWNVFLLGNIKEIKKSMIEWQNTFVNWSKKEMQAEKNSGDRDVFEFDSNGANIDAVTSRLDKLSNLYTKRDKPTLLGLLFFVLCYFLMLVPYFLQDRFSKNQYRLFKNPPDTPDLLDQERQTNSRLMKKNKKSSTNIQTTVPIIGSDDDFDTEDDDNDDIKEHYSDEDDSDDDFDYNQTIKVQ